MSLSVHIDTVIVELSQDFDYLVLLVPVAESLDHGHKEDAGINREGLNVSRDFTENGDEHVRSGSPDQANQVLVTEILRQKSLESGEARLRMSMNTEMLLTSLHVLCTPDGAVFDVGTQEIT